MTKKKWAKPMILLCIFLILVILYLALRSKNQQEEEAENAGIFDWVQQFLTTNSLFYFPLAGLFSSGKEGFPHSGIFPVLVPPGAAWQKNGASPAERPRGGRSFLQSHLWGGGLSIGNMFLVLKKILQLPQAAGSRIPHLGGAVLILYHRVRP